VHSASVGNFNGTSPGDRITNGKIIELVKVKVKFKLKVKLSLSLTKYHVMKTHSLMIKLHAL